MTLVPPAPIARREALRRVALLLGGALSAPAVAGVLAGCDGRTAQTTARAPRVLTGDRGEQVATIAEHIIPATDTPGARAARVPEFVDARWVQPRWSSSTTAGASRVASLTRHSRHPERDARNGRFSPVPPALSHRHCVRGARRPESQARNHRLVPAYRDGA